MTREILRGYTRFFRNGDTWTFLDTSATSYSRITKEDHYNDAVAFDENGPRDFRTNYPVINTALENSLTGTPVGEEVTLDDIPTKVYRLYKSWERLQ